MGRYRLIDYYGCILNYCFGMRIISHAKYMYVSLVSVQLFGSSVISRLNQRLTSQQLIRTKHWLRNRYYSIAIDRIGMKKRKLIIDTDVGFDDVAAISILDLDCNDHEIVHIQTTHGMTEPTVAANLLSSLFADNSFYKSRPKVVKGSEKPLPGGNFLDAEEWCNDYRNQFKSILNVPLIQESNKDTDSYSNFFLSCNSEEEIQPDTTLLCLGSLTNIAKIIQQDSTQLKMIDKVVIMGGATLVAGNMASGAECNFHLDPIAAQTILKSLSDLQIPIYLFGLEVANEAAVNATTREEMKSILLNNGYDNRDIAWNEPIDPITVLKKIAFNFPDGLCYDSVVSYYLIDSCAFKFITVGINIDQETGVTSLSPQALELVRKTMDNVDVSPASIVPAAITSSTVAINLAVDFDRIKYMDYLREMLHR